MKYWLNRVHIYLCDAVDEFCLFQSLQWFQLILSTAKHWHENLNCWCRVEYIHSLHLSLSNFLSHLSKIFVPFVPSIVHFVPKILSFTKKCKKRLRQNGQKGLWFNTDQNLMVLNGPAGLGKTIILLAKIIKLIRSNPQNKVVLFYFSLSCKHHQLLQDIFQKANISNDVLKERSLDRAEMTVQKLINSREKNQVVLVKMELIYYNPDFETALGCLIEAEIKQCTNLYKICLLKIL